MREQALARLGIPEAAFTYMNYPATFDATEAQAALAGRDRVPAAARLRWKIWDYWERHLDPQLPTPANVRRVVGERVVVVTGASSGIGRAVCSHLAASGAVIIGVARRVEQLEEMRDEVARGGGKAFIYPTDLSDHDACTQLIQQVIADHGRVDVLINNAGRSIRRSVLDLLDRFHDFERTMKLNYFGAIALIMAVIPGMRERQDGHIINITSIGGQAYPPRFAAYVASKNALDAFSRCFAPEVAGEGIAVTTIHMPLVRTPMIAPTGMYRNFPTISSDEAADMVVEALIKRPHEVSTRVGKFGELVHAIAPKASDTILNTAYKLFPESQAAKGKGEEAPDKLATTEAVAFAHLMKGVHW